MVAEEAGNRSGLAHPTVIFQREILTADVLKISLEGQFAVSGNQLNSQEPPRTWIAGEDCPLRVSLNLDHMPDSYRERLRDLLGK